MTTLEEKALSSARIDMWKGTIPNLLHYWNNTFKLKGGNEHYVYQLSLQRDVIGFLISHFVFLLSGYIYGSFVSSLFTGKPWGDIDICFSKVQIIDKISIAVKIINFISEVLDLPKHKIRLQELESLDTYNGEVPPKMSTS